MNNNRREWQSTVCIVVIFIYISWSESRNIYANKAAVLETVKRPVADISCERWQIVM